MSEHLDEIDALKAERDRVMDAEPAGALSAARQSELIGDLSRRINELAEVETDR